MIILNMFDCKIEFNHFFIIIIKSCSTSPPGGNQVDGLPPAACCLLRSFARSFCNIFAILCDFLRSSAIFCGLLRLLQSSANFRSIEISAAIFCELFDILRSSADFCSLLRPSAVFLNGFNSSLNQKPGCDASDRM